MYQRNQYPPNWKDISRACKEQANWRCQRCNIRHEAKRFSRRTGAEYTVYLHAAHQELNDTQNPQPHLKALCPTCHGRLDAKLRRRARRLALERKKHQRLLAKHHECHPSIP